METKKKYPILLMKKIKLQKRNQVEADKKKALNRQKIKIRVKNPNHLMPITKNFLCKMIST